MGGAEHAWVEVNLGQKHEGVTDVQSPLGADTGKYIIFLKIYFVSYYLIIIYLKVNNFIIILN